MKFFDSRDIKYRRPFGALPSGTAMEVTVKPPGDWGLTGVYLVAEIDATGERREIALKRTGGESGCDVYSGSLQTNGLLGLIWYHFRLERENEPPMYYGNNEAGYGGEGRFGDWPKSYQLTVYDGASVTPDWYGQTVTYHIFPDRFARKGQHPGLASMIGRRSLHENWDDTPDFMPNLAGEITNSDFFGGNIAGILDKLDYLASLGVGTLYLSPIFEAASNHRYDTADYHAVDKLFGDEKQFEELCAEAKKRGIRVMLDGVFNHTGCDSRYFNMRGSFSEPGAYQSKDSPYYEWYDFVNWPNEYSSWWGIYTLPQVNESNESYREFLMEGTNSVVRKWLRLGASGWRLDVVDEVPDDFVVQLNLSARAEKPDAVIIGEVWEDASNKVAYGVRRKYFNGNELDGVMNYPLRDALLGYLLGGSGDGFLQRLESLRENYPRSAFYSLMNFLGNHDTPRVLTVLGADPALYQQSKTDRAYSRLSPEQRKTAVARLKMGSLLLYCFPGSPCVFYGDEAGLEGFEDPLNRRTYPWGREDGELLAWYRRLGELRRERDSLKKGEIEYLQADGAVLCIAREYGTERLIAAANNAFEHKWLDIKWPAARAVDLMTGNEYHAEDGRLRLELPPLAALLLTTG